MTHGEAASGPITVESRAIIVVNSNNERTSRPASISLPDAGFLTQIIASAGHMGHFRRYRRTEPALAMTSYQAAASLLA